jgi:hypothetical protein
MHPRLIELALFGLVLQACSAPSVIPAEAAIGNRATLVALGPASISRPIPPPAGEVDRLGLPSFYRKYVSAGGLPIVASERVCDYALQEAAYLALGMLQGRPDVLQTLIESRLRVVVMAHDEVLTSVPEYSDLDGKYYDGRARGLAPQDARRLLVTVAEENVLSFPGDPYEGQSVFIHEFAHAIATKALWPNEQMFEAKLKTSYLHAQRTGLWQTDYASTSYDEYWAELVQAWFDADEENDPHNNHVNTRVELLQYDPMGAALIGEFLGNSPFRYVDTTIRQPPGHLRGLDRSTLPTFSWPAEVIRLLQPLPVGQWRERRSVLRSPAATIHFHNQRDQEVLLFWLDLEGKLQLRAQIQPHSELVARTQVEHCFVVTDETREPLAGYCAEPGATRALIPQYY